MHLHHLHHKYRNWVCVSQRSNRGKKKNYSMETATVTVFLWGVSQSVDQHTLAGLECATCFLYGAFKPAIKLFPTHFFFVWKWNYGHTQKKKNLKCCPFWEAVTLDPLAFCLWQCAMKSTTKISMLWFPCQGYIPTCSKCCTATTNATFEQIFPEALVICRTLHCSDAKF